MELTDLPKTEFYLLDRVIDSPSYGIMIEVFWLNERLTFREVYNLCGKDAVVNMIRSAFSISNYLNTHYMLQQIKQKNLLVVLPEELDTVKVLYGTN